MRRGWWPTSWRNWGRSTCSSNSAGAAKRTAPDDLTAQAWHDAMDAKFFSYVHPVDIVVKQMAARGRGAIVNIIGMGGKVAIRSTFPAARPTRR